MALSNHLNMVSAGNWETLNCLSCPAASRRGAGSRGQGAINWMIKSRAASRKKLVQWRSLVVLLTGLHLSMVGSGPGSGPGPECVCEDRELGIVQGTWGQTVSGIRGVSWERGLWKPSHQVVFKFSFSVRNTNKEKFTVDTKMSCLHPSSFKAAYSGKDAKCAMFPQPPSTGSTRPWSVSGKAQGLEGQGRAWCADTALHQLHVHVCLFRLYFRVRIGRPYSTNSFQKSGSVLKFDCPH